MGRTRGRVSALEGSHSEVHTQKEAFPIGTTEQGGTKKGGAESVGSPEGETARGGIFGGEI